MSKVKDAAYKQYKKMREKEKKEALKKAKKSIYYNPLSGGPLSKDKDPLRDVKGNK
jgi:hypothetical protein